MSDLPIADDENIVPSNGRDQKKSKSRDLATTTTIQDRLRRIARRVLTALGRPTILLTLANIGAQAMSFLAGLIVARFLGTVGRGQVTLVQAYDDVSTNILSIGLPDATGYLARERVASEARVLGAALQISLVMTPLTAAIGWFTAHFMFRGFPVGIQVIVWAAIGMTPLTNSFLNSCRMLLVAKGDIRTLSPLLIAGASMRVTVLLVLIICDAFNPTSAAIAFVGTGWFGQILGWRAVKIRPRRGGPIRPMLKFGIRTIPGSLASMANTRLDQLLVAPVLSTAALGIYSVAIGVNILPITAATALAHAGYHKVQGTQGPSTDARPLRKPAVGIAACSLATACGIVLLLEPVYGDAFHGAILPGLILVPGSAASGMFLVVWSIGNAIGDPGLTAKAQLAGLLVTIIGLPLVLPRLGVNGAALVSTTSGGARLAAGLWLLTRRGVKL